MWGLLKWFTKDWWDYLLTGGDYSEGCGRAGFSFRKLFCRLKGHGSMVWYSSGLEPDYRCRDCGDEL